MPVQQAGRGWTVDITINIFVKNVYIKEKKQVLNSTLNHTRGLQFSFSVIIVNGSEKWLVNKKNYSRDEETVNIFV